MFFSVNMKSIFRLAQMAILTNLVFTQNLYLSPLDDIRNSLMSFSSGADSPKPTAKGNWVWGRPMISKFTESLLFAKTKQTAFFQSFCPHQA